MGWESMDCLDVAQPGWMRRVEMKSEWGWGDGSEAGMRNNGSDAWLKSYRGFCFLENYWFIDHWWKKKKTFLDVNVQQDELFGGCCCWSGLKEWSREMVGMNSNWWLKDKWEWLIRWVDDQVTSTEKINK